MENNIKEIELHLNYLKSEYMNIIMKRERLNRLKNKYNDSINDINDELKDVYKEELELRVRIGLLRFEMKENEKK